MLTGFEVKKQKKQKQDIKLHRQFDPKLELIDYNYIYE